MAETNASRKIIALLFTLVVIHIIWIGVGTDLFQSPSWVVRLQRTFEGPSNTNLVSLAKPWLVHFSEMVKNLTKHPEQLVCSVAIFETGKFILFTTGFRHHKSNITNCVVNSQKVAVKKTGADMFECKETPTRMSEEDVLSIQLSDGTIVPSLAVWSDRTPLSIGDHPKMPVCIMTMMKNEEGKIADWIEYHTRQGVGLFLVYHNNSTDNTLSELQKHPQVVVVDWPWKKSKNEVINHGILHMRDVCEWVFHIDVDEYIFPIADYARFTVREMMYQFPKWVNSTKTVPDAAAVDQVCLETKVMGTSGYIRCPKLPVAEAYIEFDTWWFKVFGKCAVRSMRALPRSGVHRFSVSGKTVYLMRHGVHLVHYKYQCWEYYMTKYHKGRSAGNTRNWNIKRLNKDKPQKPWRKASGPTDTAFRDYKRLVDTWPLQPATIQARHS